MKISSTSLLARSVVVAAAIIALSVQFAIAQTAPPSSFPTLGPGETYPSGFPTLAPGETYPPSSEMPTLAPGETYPSGYPTLAPGETYPSGYPTLAPGETYPPSSEMPTLAPGETYAPFPPGSFSGYPTAPTNPDVQILDTIKAEFTAANPLPAAPTCPSQFQNGQWDALLMSATLSYTQEQGATWFAGNFSSRFPNGFNLKCLLDYWATVKFSVSEVDCIHSGTWTGSNTGLPSGFPTLAPGQTTQNPLSELMSSVISSIYESILHGTTAAPGAVPLDANYQNDNDRQEFRDALAQSSATSMGGGSFPSGPDPNAPSSTSMQSQFPTDAPVSGSGSSQTPTMPPQTPTGTAPACSPFGPEAKCIMYHNDLLRTVILAAWKKQYPGCFCTTNCPTYTTHTPAPTFTTKPGFTTTTTTKPPVTSSQTTAPSSGGTTKSPTTSSPTSGGTTSSSQTTPAPTSGGTTASTQNTPAPSSGGTTASTQSTPAPSSGGTTASTQSTTAPSSGGTTSPSNSGGPRTTVSLTTISTAKSTTPAPIPLSPTTTTTTATATTTTTRVSDAPATNAPPARPTVATATLTGPYNATKITDMLVAKLLDSASNFQVSQIGNSTIEVRFLGPKAADNAAAFAQLDINALDSASLASPTLQPETTPAPTPEPSGSNLAMIAGIAIGALVVIAAIAFLIYRQKKSSGGDGQKLNFNLDYDEEAFLGKYGDEMESMSGGGSALKL